VLIRKGMKIVARSMLDNTYGEIDIIAVDKRTVVFVESRPALQLCGRTSGGSIKISSDTWRPRRWHFLNQARWNKGSVRRGHVDLVP
jgi:Holliday junction resolvase-like predicted endonuclease